MDAKTLLDWFTNAPEGSQPFYAIPEEGRGTLRSALRLAATLEGPEEATPETDACQGSDGTIRECDELADKSRSLEQRMYRALRALRECEERAGKIEVERDSFKGYAESLHGWMDRVLSCVERAEQDIGGETMGAIILAGGPIYESFSEYLAALAAKGMAMTDAKPAKHVQTDRCGFDRNGSHSAGHYVCECGWEAAAAALSNERK